MIYIEILVVLYICIHINICIYICIYIIIYIFICVYIYKSIYIEGRLTYRRKKEDCYTRWKSINS